MCYLILTALLMLRLMHASECDILSYFKNFPLLQKLYVIY